MTSHLVWLEYDTRVSSPPVDEIHMTIKFLSKNRAITNCTHETQIRTMVAGMSREVCNACGKVSVGYVENHLGAEGSQKLEAAGRLYGNPSGS